MYHARVSSAIGFIFAALAKKQNTRQLRIQEPYINTRPGFFINIYPKRVETQYFSIENASFDTYLRLVCQKIKNPRQVCDF